MFYVVYGKDTIKSRKKLHELLQLAKKKRPEAEVFKLTTENWSEGQLDELLVSRGLFEQKYTTVLDGLFENKEIKNFIIDRLPEMKESEQIFLCLERDIDATSLKKIEKYAEKVQEFTKTDNTKPDFNIFSVASGLVERDRKRLWVSYLEALEKGSAPEEIHGIFFWQIKNMILASRCSSQSETGLSPFVYKNALSGSRKYKTEELLEKSSSLVEMTHKVRSGKGDMDTMLEKW
ncbi:MAG TPA: hypothetical protein VGC58_02845, partial [Candidatus Paceibacterota bacterium]